MNYTTGEECRVGDIVEIIRKDRWAWKTNEFIGGVFAVSCLMERRIIPQVDMEDAFYFIKIGSQDCDWHVQNCFKLIKRGPKPPPRVYVGLTNKKDI